MSDCINDFSPRPSDGTKPAEISYFMMQSIEAELATIGDWVTGGIVPGVSAVVVDSQGIRAQCVFGDATPEPRRRVTSDTLFALASLTKPLVATAVMVALEEGLLSLDADIRDGFTLRHLLSHASGLDERGERPTFTPGSERLYCNPGYVIVANELADTSGMTVASYLRSAVLEPLGIDGNLGVTEADDGRVATVQEPGTYSGGEYFNSTAFRRGERAAGGAYATAEGYGRLLTCLLARGVTAHGSLLADETVEEMLACQFGELPGTVPGVGSWSNLAWGLGFDVRGSRTPHWTGSVLSARASSHFGASGTLAWLDPEFGLGCVVLANRGSYSGWWREPWALLTERIVTAI